MAQFDLHINTGVSKNVYPFLLDIQVSQLDMIDTRLVVPVIARSQIRNRPITILTPEFDLNGKQYVLLMPQMSGIPKSELGQFVTSLSLKRQEIVGAVDFIVTGI